MNHEQAKIILERYRVLIKDLRPHAIVQSNDVLRRAPATIKYAHFVYGEYLVKESLITDEELQILMESYGLLESYFVEDPDSINKKYREFMKRLSNGVISDFQIPNPFGEPSKVFEYFNFIGDCFARFRMDGLKHEALGAFLFEAVRAKACSENDLKTIIDLAKSGITRAIKLASPSASNA